MNDIHLQKNSQKSTIRQFEIFGMQYFLFIVRSQGQIMYVSGSMSLIILSFLPQIQRLSPANSGINGVRKILPWDD